MLNFIITSVLTATWILCFRSFKSLNINTLQAVVVNYWICVLTGVISFGLYAEVTNFDKPWLIYANILGTLFFITFYQMARTTQIIGVTATTVAAKISLVIPVLFALFVFKTQVKFFDFWNYTGVGLTLLAIYFSAQSNQSNAQSSTSKVNSLFLPILIFLLSALIDTSVNFLNWKYIPSEDSALFLIFAFGSAAVVGSLYVTYLIIKKSVVFDKKALFGGLYLGIPNFFSLYFLLQTLSDFNNDGAFIFPLFNIAVILISAIFAIILFREKLSKLNWLGLGIAVLAMFLIAYQEILSYFEILPNH